MSHELVSLSDLIDKLESGGRPKGGVGSLIDGIPSLGAEHLNSSGSFKFNKVKYISDEFYNSQKSGKIKVNDILIVKDGATTGKTSFVDTDFPYSKASINEHLFRISVNESKIFAKYAFYYLSSDIGNRQILTDFRGATVGGISKKFANVVKIPLPSLAEQQQIVAILDEADKLRQKDQQLVEHYTQLSQSLFLDMFGDPISNNKQIKIVNVGDVVSEIKDGPHVSPEYSNSGIPILSTRNIRPFSLLLDELKYVSEEMYKKLTSRFCPKKGDVLLTKGGTTGYAKVVDFDWDFCIWVHLAALRPKFNIINPKFLEAALNSEYCYQQSQFLTKGIANRDLGLKRIVTIKLFLPDIKIQNQFAERVAVIERQKQQAQANLAKSNDLFNALLQKAFTGELTSKQAA